MHYYTCKHHLVQRGNPNESSTWAQLSCRKTEPLKPPPGGEPEDFGLEAFPKHFQNISKAQKSFCQRRLNVLCNMFFLMFVGFCWRFRGAWQSEKLESAFARICPLQILFLSGPQPPRAEPRPRTFSTDPIRNFCRAEVKFFERLTLA